MIKRSKRAVPWSCWARLARFGPKVGQIGPKWDNRWAKMYWNLIWKSPGFVPFWVRPIWPTLGPNFDILVCWAYAQHIGNKMVYDHLFSKFSAYKKEREVEDRYRYMHFKGNTTSEISFKQTVSWSTNSEISFKQTKCHWKVDLQHKKIPIL